MKKLSNGYKVYTEGRLMGKTKTELVAIIRELERTVEMALEAKIHGKTTSSNIYSGVVDINKVVFYHEKEAFMGQFSGNTKRAEFHNKVVKVLKEVKSKL